MAQPVAIGNRHEPEFQLSTALEKLVAAGSSTAALVSDAPVPRRSTGSSRQLSDDDIIAALREHRFQVSATAAALGLSKTWLFTRIERCDRIRKASDLQSDEIRVSLEACAADVDAAAERLEVSSHGLKQRMKQLGLR